MGDAAARECCDALDDNDELCATLDDSELFTATLVDDQQLVASLANLQILAGPGVAVVFIDGANVFLPVLPNIAIAADAVSPNLGTQHALAWSTVLNAPVVWNGTAWKPLSAGGVPPVDPLQLTNDQGEVLVNNQGEAVNVG